MGKQASGPVFTRRSFALSGSSGGDRCNIVRTTNPTSRMLFRTALSERTIAGPSASTMSLHCTFLATLSLLLLLSAARAEPADAIASVAVTPSQTQIAFGEAFEIRFNVGVYSARAKDRKFPEKVSGDGWVGALTRTSESGAYETQGRIVDRHTATYAIKPTRTGSISVNGITLELDQTQIELPALTVIVLPMELRYPVLVRGAGKCPDSESDFLSMWRKAQSGSQAFIWDFASSLVGKSFDDPVLEMDIGRGNVSKVIERCLAEPTSPLITEAWRLVKGRLLMYGAPGLHPRPSEAVAMFQLCNEHTLEEPEIQREAQFEIGLALMTGSGVQQDVAAGEKWIQRAADKGYDPALVFLKERVTRADAHRDGSSKTAAANNSLSGSNLTTGSVPTTDGHVVVSLSNHVSVELPMGWKMLNEGEVGNAASVAASAAAKSGQSRPGPSLSADATYSDASGKVIALFNVRYYPDATLTQKDTADATAEDISKIDAGIKSGMQTSGGSMGWTVLEWKGTKPQLLNGTHSLLTEYTRSGVGGAGPKCVRLVRVFNGNKSFTITVSHDLAKDAELRPVTDRIIASIKIGDIVGPAVESGENSPYIEENKSVVDPDSASKSGTDNNSPSTVTNSTHITFENARDGFRISIPPDWQEIPESKIAEKVAAVRKASPDIQVPDFQYGYQARSDQWFTYPYVLVSIKRSGRVPEYQLAKLQNVDWSVGGKAVQNLSDGQISHLEMGKVAYDPSTHIIWMASEATYPEVGKVGILNGSVQTQEGSIWVYGYALRDTFEANKPTFAQIAESVLPTEALRYKPRWTDSALVGVVVELAESLRGSDWARVAGKGVAVGLLVLIVGIFSWLKSVSTNRRKPE